MAREATASRSIRSASIGAAALLVAACASPPTVLKVVSDPPGAEVDIDGLGAVGETPLEYALSPRELAVLDKVAGERVTLPITLTLPAFLTERDLVRMPIGQSYTHFVRLEKRSEVVRITTEPEGVGVFELTVDVEAGPAVRMLFDSSPMKALKQHPKWITRHYIGNTPLEVAYDPANPLDHNDVLLFKKAGYHAELGYFKEREDRIHVVMMPQVTEAR